MQARLAQYIQEVLRFRKALNLTSISDPEVFAQRFVQPSVLLGQWMPDEGRLLDVGSGMGVPGIPLLIAKPNMHGVLVERRKKRAEFLRHVGRVLALNLEVYDEDIQDIPCLNIDVCVARAVTAVPALLEMCARHVRVGGIAVLPVPREQGEVKLSGWHLECVHDKEMQRIQCYRRGDVSHET